MLTDFGSQTELGALGHLGHFTRFCLAPGVGLEPTTFALTAHCSAIELPGNNKLPTAVNIQSPISNSQMSNHQMAGILATILFLIVASILTISWPSVNTSSEVENSNNFLPLSILNQYRVSLASLRLIDNL